MNNFFVLLFLVSIPAFIVSLVWPRTFPSLFRGKIQKRGVRWLFGLLIPFSLFLIGATSDQQSATNNPPAVSVQDVSQTAPEKQADTQNNIEAVAPEPVVEVKEEKTTEDVPFQIATKKDSTLEEGKTSVVQKGVKGVKEFVYEVTFTDGKETDRKLESENITSKPVDEIDAIGTKPNQPVSVAPASCGADYYVNVDGNCVHRPGNNPSGASAQCRDGSYSYSQHRSGTCSGHGGVSTWY